jgi:hypothetical protein
MQRRVAGSFVLWWWRAHAAGSAAASRLFPGMLVVPYTAPKPIALSRYSCARTRTGGVSGDRYWR